ncbi:MAG: hypothetical protein IT314_05570 [Anaerolineales bacterium]|nr:hypothetical protein [Anaerolineales bacterium]
MKADKLVNGGDVFMRTIAAAKTTPLLQERNMQGKTDLIHIKRKSTFRILIPLLILAIATPVLADYLGPDRTTIESYVDTYEYGVWARDNNKAPYCLDKWGNQVDACIVCEWERKPGKACGDAEYWYTLGTKSEVVETTTNLPPATINSSMQNCTLNNGWCITAPELSLNGSEPLSGYSILAIEGSLNGLSFACSTSSCNIPLNEGKNDFTYWALSSYGDSSEMGTLAANVDTVPPNAGLDILASNGMAGWFVSPATITATGSDATSGLQSVALSLDNLTWQSATILNDGIHTVTVQAQDNAGNISTSSTIVSVDTTTPSIDVATQGTSGKNRWYSSNMTITASASDATSGIETLELTVDGGPWMTVNGPWSFSDGYHTLQFKATDKAGNVTQTPLREFLIDALAPAVDIPFTWNVGETVAYKVQDTGSGLSALRVVIEDEDERFAKVAWNEEVSGEKFNGEIAWDGKFKDGTLAPPGEYLVWIKAQDNAGNERFGLGRVIVPQPQTLFSIFTSPTDSAETPTPPKELIEPSDTISPASSPNNSSASTPLSTRFGNSTNPTQVTTQQSLALTSGTASSSAATTNSNILWGAGVAAMIGATMAYALDERRKRKAAESNNSYRTKNITSTKSNTQQNPRNISLIPTNALGILQIKEVETLVVLDPGPPDWLDELITKGKRFIKNAINAIQEKWNIAKQKFQESVLGQFFPELTWKELDSTERESVLQSLSNYGPYGQPTAVYINQSMVDMGFFPQKTGAGWTLFGNLILKPGIDLNSPFNNSLIVHEVLHLQQPLLTRLSVYGELLAWQLQYQAYYDVTGLHFGEQGATFSQDPLNADRWKILSQLNPDSLQDLETAQKLMREIDPAYRSNLLPLEPISKTISRKVLRVGSGITKSIIAIGQITTTAITQTSQAVSNTITNLGASTAKKIVQTSTSIASSIIVTGQNIAKTVTQTNERIARGVVAGGQAIGNLIAKTNPNVARAVIDISQSLSTATTKIGQSIASGIKSTSQKISNAVQHGGESLVKTISTGSQTLAKTVNAVGQTVANAVTKVTKSVANTVKSLTTSIANWFWKP